MIMRYEKRVKTLVSMDHLGVLCIPPEVYEEEEKK